MLTTTERLTEFIGRNRKARFNVAPRYTCGSPAPVNREIALAVASEEIADYERTISGAYGEEQKARAEKLGLAGIVECRIERSKHWRVLDLITGEVFDRPFPR